MLTLWPLRSPFMITVSPILLFLLVFCFFVFFKTVLRSGLAKSISLHVVPCIVVYVTNRIWIWIWIHDYTKVFFTWVDVLNAVDSRWALRIEPYSLLQDRIISIFSLFHAESYDASCNVLSRATDNRHNWMHHNFVTLYVYNYRIAHLSLTLSLCRFVSLVWTTAHLTGMTAAASRWVERRHGDESLGCHGYGIIWCLISLSN